MSDVTYRRNLDPSYSKKVFHSFRTLASSAQSNTRFAISITKIKYIAISYV